MTKDDIAKLPTPRTDALLLIINEGCVYTTDGPTANLARRLERENAALRQQLSLYADTSAYGLLARLTIAAIREYQEEA